MRSRARLFVRLSVAHARRHRARFVVTTLGIALGVASVTGVLALTRSIVSGFEDAVTRTAGKAQLQLANGTAGVERSLVDVAAAVRGVAVASGTVQSNVSVPVLGRRVTVFGFEIGHDDEYREAQVGPGALHIEDSVEFVSRLDSVALSTTILAERGWGPGDTLEVLGPHGPRTLTIRGSVRPDGALRAFGADVAVMDADAAQRAFGAPDRFDWIDVVVGPGVSVAGVEQALVAAVGERASVGTPTARGRSMETFLHLMRVLFAAMAVVGGLVALFLIQHAVAMSVRQRQRDIALLKALGLSRAQLVVHLVGEWAVVGAAGSAIGAVAGVGFWALASRRWSLAMDALIPDTGAVHAFAITRLELAVVLLGGVATAVAAAIGPSIGALRLRPIGTLRPDAPAQSRPARFLPVLGGVFMALAVVMARATAGRGDAAQIATITATAAAIFAGVTLLAPSSLAALTPVAGRLARRRWGILGTWSWQQVLRRRAHGATTIGALAAGVAYAVALAALLGSYRGDFLEWFNQTYPADVVVMAGSSLHLHGQLLDLEAADAVAGVPGVARVSPQRLVEVPFRGRPIYVQGTGAAVLERMHPGVARDDPADVIVSESFATRLGMRVGERFTLPAPVPFPVRVAAVVPDFTMDIGLVKVAWPAFVEHYGDARATMLHVDAAPGVAARDLKARIEAAFGDRIDGFAMTAGDMRETIVAIVDGLLSLTYWLELLAGLVAVSATIHASAASIMDRRRQLSTWRALGLSAGRLRALLVGEAGTLAAVGAVLGVLSGTLLGCLLIDFVTPAVTGYHLRRHWSVATMAELLFVATLAGIVTSRAVASRRLGARDLAALAARG